MRIYRSLAALAATLLIAVGLAVPSDGGLSAAPSAHAAPARPVVNQGDEIIIDRGQGVKASCTVAYVDARHRLAMTAGHCVTVPGLPVMNAQRQRIGTVVTPPLDAFPGQNDFAYILLHGADPGRNGYSGPNKIHPNHIRPGERVCTHGATTRRTVCGTVHAVRGGAVFVAGMPPTTHGDSGGPSWIPGRGFVGPHSGRTDSGFSMFSTPYIYVGPDLVWFWATDLRMPVARGNLIVDAQLDELSSAIDRELKGLIPAR